MTPSTCACAAARPRTVAEWNDTIREYCAGRDTWTAEELAELGRLRAGWRAATDAEDRAA